MWSAFVNSSQYTYCNRPLVRGVFKFCSLLEVDVEQNGLCLSHSPAAEEVNGQRTANAKCDGAWIDTDRQAHRGRHEERRASFGYFARWV